MVSVFFSARRSWCRNKQTDAAVAQDCAEEDLATVIDHAPAACLTRKNAVAIAIDERASVPTPGTSAPVRATSRNLPPDEILCRFERLYLTRFSGIK